MTLSLILAAAAKAGETAAKSQLDLFDKLMIAITVFVTVVFSLAFLLSMISPKLDAEIFKGFGCRRFL